MDYEAIFPKTLAKLFPERAARAEVEKILAEYGTEKFHRENSRVKMAILKVAGINIDEIKRFTEIACCDYRDILCMAEYPNQSSRFGLKEKDPEKYKKLVQKDLHQHQEWMDRMSV